MPKKKRQEPTTAEDHFWDIIDDKLGWDNSTGDYNRYAFEFIDSKNLQQEFRRFLMKEAAPTIEAIIYDLEVDLEFEENKFLSHAEIKKELEFQRELLKEFTEAGEK